jgi:hypothetical protein
MQVQVGKVYKIFGNKTQRVVKIDERNIHTMWTNGTVPRYQSDRLYPIEWAKHFVGVDK